MILGLGERLTTDHYVSSEMGLSSVSTLIIGTKAAVLVDPSFFLTDAAECAAWIKKKIGSKELSAVFITHHHPEYLLFSPLISLLKQMLISGSLLWSECDSGCIPRGQILCLSTSPQSNQ